MASHLTSVSNGSRTPQMCVILTRAVISLRFEPRIAPLSSSRGNQRCQDAARNGMGNQYARETTPLWVWLSVALLALGTLAYFAMVYLVEYIIGFL
jgi:hypothetical protein